MSIGLVGKKSGMSRLFQEDGTSVPVTVISVAANFVADIKTHEKHGYSAIVVSKNTSKNLTKSSTEFFKKQNVFYIYIMYCVSDVGNVLQSMRLFSEQIR